MAAPSFLDRSEVSSLLKKVPAAVLSSAAIEDSGLAGKNPSAKKPGKREIPPACGGLPGMTGSRGFSINCSTQGKALNNTSKVELWESGRNSFHRQGSEILPSGAPLHQRDPRSTMPTLADCFGQCGRKASVGHPPRSTPTAQYSSAARSRQFQNSHCKQRDRSSNRSRRHGHRISPQPPIIGCQEKSHPVV